MNSNWRRISTFLLVAVLLLPALQVPVGAQAVKTCAGEPVDVDLSDPNVERNRLNYAVIPEGSVVRGTPGDDFILGGRTVCGLGGNDTILVFEGSSVFAGAGDDTVFAGRRTDEYSNFPNLIVGGPGDDLLVGGMKADRMLGGPGRDRIQGRGGNDKIWGGPGDDVIRGHWGTDRIFGGDGNDAISAGDGNDMVRAGNGADIVEGGPGIDTCASGQGDKTRTGCEILG